jgi:hypothetical protein
MREVIVLIVVISRFQFRHTYLSLLTPSSGFETELSTAVNLKGILSVIVQRTELPIGGYSSRPCRRGVKRRCMDTLKAVLTRRSRQLQQRRRRRQRQQHHTSANGLNGDFSWEDGNYYFRTILKLANNEPLPKALILHCGLATFSYCFKPR